jgi:hypothetical protein
MENSLTPNEIGEVSMFKHRTSLREDSLERSLCSSIFPGMLDVREELLRSELLMYPNVKFLVHELGAPVKLPCLKGRF